MQSTIFVRTLNFACFWQFFFKSLSTSVDRCRTNEAEKCNSFCRSQSILQLRMQTRKKLDYCICNFISLFEHLICVGSYLTPSLPIVLRSEKHHFCTYLKGIKSPKKIRIGTFLLNANCVYIWETTFQKYWLKW